jgi:hypothetical protein
MNNRIKELGLQAANWLDDQEPVNTAHAMQLYQEKFAELIVRECAELCLKHAEFWGPFQQMEFRKGQHFYTIIKNHFGVKE